VTSRTYSAGPQRRENLRAAGEPSAPRRTVTGLASIEGAAVSELELRRAVESCVESLTRRGRPHLAQRVGAQVDRLLRDGQTAQAAAVIGLFSPR
jgi:hypothetical protein